MRNPKLYQRFNALGVLCALLVLASIATACASDEPEYVYGGVSASQWDKPETICERLKGPYRARYDHRQFIANGGTVGAGYDTSKLSELFTHIAQRYSREPNPHFDTRSLRDLVEADRALIAHFKGSTPVSEDVADLEASASEVHAWARDQCDKIPAEHFDVRPAAEVLADAALGG